MFWFVPLGVRVPQVGNHWCEWSDFRKTNCREAEKPVTRIYIYQLCKSSWDGNCSICKKFGFVLFFFFWIFIILFHKLVSVSVPRGWREKSNAYTFQVMKDSKKKQLGKTRKKRNMERNCKCRKQWCSQVFWRPCQRITMALLLTEIMDVKKKDITII